MSAINAGVAELGICIGFKIRRPKGIGGSNPLSRTIYWAVAKSVKVSDFDSDIRVFKSHQPSHGVLDF